VALHTDVISIPILEVARHFVVEVSIMSKVWLVICVDIHIRTVARAEAAGESLVGSRLVGAVNEAL